MHNNNPQNLDIGALRQKLKSSSAENIQSRQAKGQTYIPKVHTKTPPADNPHIQRQPPLNSRLEKHQSTFFHLHNYWHIYATAMVFILFHSIGMYPHLFPGTGNMESLYGQAPKVAFFLLSLPAIAVFFTLRGLRRSLQLAGQITESKSWTTVEWTGAAIGFGFLFYWTFFHASPMEQFMVAEAIKGPFELTPREWIMAGVKCIGGAVMGAILARKFFGDSS